MKQLLMLKKTEFDSLKAGFTLTDMYKDMRGDENKFDQNFTAFMATRAVKVVNKNENHV